MTLSNKVLPSPSEVNGVAYLMSLDVVMNNGRFPSPLEVTGGSYEFKELHELNLEEGFRPLSR